MARGDGAYAHYGYDEVDAYLKDLLLEEEGATEESVQKLMDSDSVSESDRALAWDVVWEDLSNDVTDLMERVRKASGHDYGNDWLVDLSNFGWTHDGGSGTVRASSAEELLRAVLPDTENDFFVYDEGDHIVIDNAHHDAPMGGEMYRIYPASMYVVHEVYPEGVTNGYGDPEGIWANDAWGFSATDAAERCFPEDRRTHESRIRNLAAGPGDTATGEGWGGYPEEKWFRIRVERS